MNKSNYLEDTWIFYKDKSKKYRWRRTATNGQIVGASTQGYNTSKAMKDNAERNGWDLDLFHTRWEKPKIKIYSVPSPPNGIHIHQNNSKSIHSA